LKESRQKTLRCTSNIFEQWQRKIGAVYLAVEYNFGAARNIETQLRHSERKQTKNIVVIRELLKQTAEMPLCIALCGSEF
jgi:hypothetical protein